MVIDGFSIPRIKRYLNAWLAWWVRTSQSGSYQIVLSHFSQACRDRQIARLARELLLAKRHASGEHARLLVGLDSRVTD